MFRSAVAHVVRMLGWQSVDPCSRPKCYCVVRWAPIIRSTSFQPSSLKGWYHFSGLINRNMKEVPNWASPGQWWYHLLIISTWKHLYRETVDCITSQNNTLFPANDKGNYLVRAILVRFDSGSYSTNIIKYHFYHNHNSMQAKISNLWITLQVFLLFPIFHQLKGAMYWMPNNAYWDGESQFNL